METGIKFDNFGISESVLLCCTVRAKRIFITYSERGGPGKWGNFAFGTFCTPPTPTMIKDNFFPCHSEKLL